MNKKTSPIIYKYRDWRNPIHRKSLIFQELYLASPSDFNDPFDCRITQNFALLETDEAIWEFVKNLSNKNKESLFRDRVSISDFENKIFNRLKYHKDEEQILWDEYTFRKQDEHYGIISFSKIWDSILMWGHYARNHTGFCVGYYEDKLIESKYFGKGGEVTYRSHFPLLKPGDTDSVANSFTETHTKAKDWDYEKEYRFLKLFYPTPPSPEERIFQIDKSCFAELIIGLNFPKDQINEVSKMAYKLNIPLYQIKQVPYKFEIFREELI